MSWVIPTTEIQFVSPRKPPSPNKSGFRPLHQSDNSWLPETGVVIGIRSKPCCAAPPAVTAPGRSLRGEGTCPLQQWSQWQMATSGDWTPAELGLIPFLCGKHLQCGSIRGRHCLRSQEHQGCIETVRERSVACPSGVSGWAEPCTGPCISQREEFPGTEVLFAPCNLMVG